MLILLAPLGHTATVVNHACGQALLLMHVLRVAGDFATHGIIWSKVPPRFFVKNAPLVRSFGQVELANLLLQKASFDGWHLSGLVRFAFDSQVVLFPVIVKIVAREQTLVYECVRLHRRITLLEIVVIISNHICLGGKRRPRVIAQTTTVSVTQPESLLGLVNLLLETFVLVAQAERTLWHA